MAPERFVSVLGGVGQKAMQCEPEVRCGLERRQAERIHEDQLAEPVAVVAGKAGADGPAERVPHENGRRWAGVFDQLAQPRHHAIGVEGAVPHLRAALAGQVGDHQRVRAHQISDHPHPVAGVSPRAVQQHHRRTFAPLQHGGRHARQLPLSLGEGDPGQQLATGIDLTGHLCVLGCHATTVRRATRARIARIHQVPAAGGVVISDHASAQTSSFSKAKALAAVRDDTPSLAKMF